MINNYTITYIYILDIKLGGIHMPEQYLTTKQIASSLQMTELQVRNLIKTGQLPASKLGHRSYRIKESDFESYMESKKTIILDN